MKKIILLQTALLCLAALSLPATSRAQSNQDFCLPAQTFFAQSASPSDKKVFGWYMVCCGPAIGGWSLPHDQLVAGYKNEIQQAQSMGIDGFGLDIMEPNDAYHNCIAAMFEAAQQLGTGFQLFFECDYGRPKLTPGDYAALVEQYAHNPNYFKVNGNPMVCAYGADCGSYGLNPDPPVSWWKDSNPTAAIAWWKSNLIAPLKAAGINVYFIPTTWWQLVLGGGNDTTSEQEMAAWGDSAQGMSLWQIANSPIGGGLTVLNRQAVDAHKAGKSWMDTIAEHYWWGSSYSVPSWHWKSGESIKPDNSNRNGKYFEHAGGMGLETQWKAAMQDQHADWVMLLTWNDYNESYIQPIDDYKKYHNGTVDAPLGWYKPQVGMDELNRYYTQWYKTGKEPKITSDSLFYSYITQSSKVTADKDPRPRVECANGPSEDDLYVTTALVSPAILRVESGTSVTEYKVGAGIVQTKSPFLAGNQVFSLLRNGKMVVSTQGEPIVDKADFYDYWPTTGYVEAHNKN